MVRSSRYSGLAVAILGSLLALLVVVHLALSVRLMAEPAEVMYGEATVYDVAARVLRGEPLYQPPDRAPYIVVAYMPLYYWLAAGLQATMGPGFGPGRILSFVAGLVTATAVAYLAAQLRGPRAGLFAAVLYLALGLPASLWSSLYRVDMVGVALSLGSIVTLGGGITTRRVILAGALVALAILTKQTLIASGLAGFIWLWRVDRRRATVFAAVGGTIVVAMCAVLEAKTGAFLAHVVGANLNPFRLDALLDNLALLVAFQAGPLAVTCLHCLGRTRKLQEPNEDLIFLYWAVSLLPLVGLAKVGSNYNYWIELAAANSVLAAVATCSGLDHQQAQTFRGRTIFPILLLGINALLVTLLVTSITRPLPHLLGLRTTGSLELAGLVERVRTEPGDVLANPLDVIVLAGRPILFEPYTFNILESQGAWDPSPVLRRICAGNVRLVVLDHPLSTPGPKYHGYAHWSASIMAALRESMVLEREWGDRYIYVPRQRSSSERCEPTARYSQITE